jgi:TetR/AcrR family transcriptional repressor of lmrAB and yxaGH operons
VSARNRLITATVGQLRRFGVAGTSVSGILEDSGLARRTLYLNFPEGKPALVAAATKVASAETVSAFERALQSESDPVRLVETFIEHSAKALEANDFAAGCPIAAAALGREEAPAAADAAGDAFAGWVSQITRIARESGIADDVAEELATMVVATVEGALIMSIAERSAQPLRRAGRCLGELVRARLDQP